MLMHRGFLLDNGKCEHRLVRWLQHPGGGPWGARNRLKLTQAKVGGRDEGHPSDSEEGIHAVSDVLLHCADRKGPSECHTGEWHTHIRRLGRTGPANGGKWNAKPEHGGLSKGSAAPWCDKMAQSSLCFRGNLAAPFKKTDLKSTQVYAEKKKS